METKYCKDAAYFMDLPMSPQSNNMYATLPDRRRIPSKELKLYQRMMQEWALKNQFIAQTARKRCQEIVNSGNFLFVEAHFFFKKEKVFTKVGGVKKMDVSNRIKAMHDCVSEIIGVDDCYFWSVSAQKNILEFNEPERVTVTIREFIFDDSEYNM